MKKIVFKKKKQIKVHKHHRVIKHMFLLAAAVSLLVGGALPASGAESTASSKGREDAGRAPKKVVTEIRHKHIGNAEQQGGCYRIPIAHRHQGNEQAGGPCYQTEVKHIHAGSESVAGGCYTKPEYHRHQGDEQTGGACYEAVHHVHSADCYQSQTCLVNHRLTGQVLETWMDTCFDHQETTFGRAAGIASHGNCGLGEEERFYRYCLACGQIMPTTHAYQELVCQIDEGAVTGYRLSCNKDDTTIERYTTECGFEESEREGYALSCTKTVDGYEPDCGFRENEPCGRIILTNETAGQSGQAVIGVRIEDLTGGRLKMQTPAFEWRNEKGQILGNGEKITVNENGAYSVLVKLENKDVDEDSLMSSILVDNIRAAVIPTPAATAATTPAPASSPAAAQTPGATSAPGSDSGQEDSDGQEENKQSPTPQKTMAPLGANGGEGTDEGGHGREISKEAGRGKVKTEEESALLAEAVPTKAPLVKISRQVKARSNEAKEESAYTVAETKKDAGFLNLPAVKVITVTGSVLLLIMGSMLLWFYLRNSVRVFNDNGQNKMIFLGRCKVKREEANYEITITEAMEENTITNRYCIRPGIFLIGKKKGEELVIHKGTKTVSVYLNKEMIAIL